MRFQNPSAWRGRWQLVNSFVPYLLLWVAMVYALAVSYWLVLPLAILAAGRAMLRLFIICRDTLAARTIDCDPSRRWAAPRRSSR
jgi:acyl-lipid omega-6 desaturase (Delta-12 desaturase)